MPLQDGKVSPDYTSGCTESLISRFFANIACLDIALLMIVHLPTRIVTQESFELPVNCYVSPKGHVDFGTKRRLWQNSIDFYHFEAPIDRLLEYQTKSAVLYIFFDFNAVKKRRHGNMVRSLLSQLSMHKGTADSQVLVSLFSSCLYGERQPTYNPLLMSLRGMMRAFEESFIIVNALDGTNGATCRYGGIVKVDLDK